ncbi:helix-turn-helix domain-containing protein [Arcticibacter sp. MXS-1]|uniref:helix-turn-helix domain-containing protein n=1 Tax=Arcticibacter sp. MXS-1 TaxID=3341726 RepID=UPI0035A8C9E7
MSKKDQVKAILDLAEKIGVPIQEQASGLARLKMHEVRVIDLMPEMLVMVRSLLVLEDVTFRRPPITAMENSLLISFQNIYRNQENQTKNSSEPEDYERAHVRITPWHLESMVRFSRQTQVTQISILIDRAYLKQFLGKDQQRFSYLFDAERTLWIEEFMSPEIAVLVDEVMHCAREPILADSFYRLKCLTMLYHLFNNLSYREPIGHQQMNANEIDAVYRVRNAMTASLDKPLSLDELTRLSGMNELKLRKFFTQVFGKGLYDYHQHLRMSEAARLLKEDKLNVSEAGYRLGFSNLSYFGRLFEEHHGIKPKKWRNQFMK